MNINISSIAPADLSAISIIAEIVNEAHVIPTLSEEGKATMRQARNKNPRSKLSRLKLDFLVPRKRGIQPESFFPFYAASGGE